MPEVRAPFPTLEIRAAGAADIGRVRPHNEDAVLVRPDLRLWVVTDGAGGHNAGNVASALALATIADHFESTERAYRAAPDVDRFGIAAGARRLSVAIRKANRDIVDVSKASKKYGGMGSTVVAATVAAHAPVLHVAHVGDSRCYRLRSGRLEQLTHDHSLLNEVLELNPDLADDALAKLPRKVVTRALGMEEAVRPAIRSFEIAADDVYLLCSDGLTGELSDEAIRRVLALAETPTELVDHLIRLAKQAGGNDNIAAVVVAIELGPPGVSNGVSESGSSGAPSVEVVDAGPASVELSVESSRAAVEASPEQGAAPGAGPHAPLPQLAPPTPRPPMVSAPEILLLGIESNVDPEEAIRVVPEGSASASLIQTLGGIFQAHHAHGAVHPCGACGAPMLAEVVFCPHCGSPRETPEPPLG